MRSASAVIRPDSGRSNWFCRIGFIIVGLTVLVPAATAAPVISDGESLRERCASFQLLSPSAALGCRGFIGALVDIFSDGEKIYGLRACIGPDEEREAVVKAVQAWLDRHPEALGKKASLLTAQALAETYPCELQ